MITLVEPTRRAPVSVPPNTPKATLLAKMTEALDSAEESSDQHRCLTHLTAIVKRFCGDNDTGNLEYWGRQLDFITHKNPTFSAWAGQLTTFAKTVFRDIEKAAPYTPIPEYHVAANTGRLTGRRPVNGRLAPRAF